MSKDADWIMISNFKPAEYNVTKISKKNMQRLQASIKEHTEAIPGWRREDGYRLCGTITINKRGNRIVGGHRRLEALQALGQDVVHKDDITWVDLEPGGAREKALLLSLNNRRSMGRLLDDRVADLVEEINEELAEVAEALDLAALVKEDTGGGAGGGGEETGEKIDDALGAAVKEIIDAEGDLDGRGFILFLRGDTVHLAVRCDGRLASLLSALSEGLGRKKNRLQSVLADLIEDLMQREEWLDLCGQDKLPAVDPGEI